MLKTKRKVLPAPGKPTVAKWKIRRAAPRAKVLLAFGALAFLAPVYAEPPDPIRVECEAALREPLQDMLKSLLSIEDTLTVEEYERLIVSIKATHEANVNLCVVGRRYFLDLPR